MQPPAKSSQRNKTWCGPYALALVAGLSYDEAYDIVCRSLRRKRVAGMWNHEVEKVSRGRLFPGRPLSFDLCPGVTLARITDHLKPRRLYIINVTGHYVIVNTRDWTVCDNQTMSWQPIKASKYARTICRSLAEAGKIAA